MYELRRIARQRDMSMKRSEIRMHRIGNFQFEYGLQIVQHCDGLLAETLAERIALKSDDFCGDDFQLKALTEGV